MGTIEKFVESTRSVFANSKDARTQAQGIANQMEALLSDPSLMEEIERKAGGKAGRIDLHVDDKYGHPGPGFCLMTAITRPGQKTGGARAHDHGASFVVYGVYKGAIEQVKYRWAYVKEGEWTSPELREADRFVQRAGQIAFFLPGEIHKTTAVGDQPPVVIRLEAQLLDRVARHSYDVDASRALPYA
jgi:hypothetical protein